MKKQKIVSAIALYIVFMFIGHQGPLAHHKKEDQPHTHTKHVVKLIKNNDEADSRLKGRKFVPLTA